MQNDRKSEPTIKPSTAALPVPLYVAGGEKKLDLKKVITDPIQHTEIISSNEIAVCTLDKIYIIDLQDMQIKKRYDVLDEEAKRYPRRIGCYSFSPDKTKVVYMEGTQGGQVWKLDLQTNQIVNFQNPAKYKLDVSFFSNERFAVAVHVEGTSNPTIEIYNSNGVYEISYDLETYYDVQICFTKDGKHLAALATDRDGEHRHFYFFQVSMGQRTLQLISQQTYPYRRAHEFSSNKMMLQITASGNFVFNTQGGLMCFTAPNIYQLISTFYAPDCLIRGNDIEVFSSAYSAITPFHDMHELNEKLKTVLEMLPPEIISLITKSTPYEPRMFRSRILAETINEHMEQLAKFSSATEEYKIAGKNLVLLRHLKMHLAINFNDTSLSMRKTRNAFPDIKATPSVQAILELFEEDEKATQPVAIKPNKKN